MSDLDPASVKAASGRGVVADLGFEGALAAGTETVVLRCGALRKGRDACGVRVASVWSTPEGVVVVTETYDAARAIDYRRTVRRLTGEATAKMNYRGRHGEARWADGAPETVEHRCYECGTTLGIDVDAVTAPGPSTRGVHPVG